MEQRQSLRVTGSYNIDSKFFAMYYENLRKHFLSLSRRDLTVFIQPGLHSQINLNASFIIN
jgi:hypothetical protein